ncbi:MAG: MaoC family dehydratase N-terminal domain-containing protein [Gammaproteobacteria bacterium]
MSEPSLVTDAMRAAVGREYRWMTSYPIEKMDIRRWALAVYYPEPAPRLFLDEDYARTTPHGGMVAPEDFNPFGWALAEDRALSDVVPTMIGPEESLGLPPLPTRANIVAGLEVQYGKVRMRPGDVIRCAYLLGGYEEKPGRMGLMLFTRLEQRWTNQRDELVKTYRTNLIRYR